MTYVEILGARFLGEIAPKLSAAQSAMNCNEVPIERTRRNLACSSMVSMSYAFSQAALVPYYGLTTCIYASR